MGRKFLLIFFFLFIIKINLFSASGNVLLLHSYHQEYKWTSDISEGIRGAFKNYPGINISVEYLDSKKASDGKYLSVLAEIYNMKYREGGLDLIICSDNDALYFLRDYKIAAFKDVPVVFCGINGFTSDDVKGMKNITGVNERTGISDTIKLMLNLHPALKKIYVVIEDTPDGKKILRFVNSISRNFSNRAELYFLTGKLSDICKTVSEAESSSAVLFTVYSSDPKGRFYKFNEVILKLRNVSKVPIYGVWDFHLGYGITGGRLVSGYAQGEEAAGLALRILKGESADSIPVVMESPNRYMFDCNELKRFNIESSQIPQESIIINKRPGFKEFFYMYSEVLYLTGLIIISLVLSLVLVIFLRERRNRKKIIDSEKLVREILNSMTEAVYLIRPDGLLLESNREGRSRINIPETAEAVNIKDYLPEDLARSRFEKIESAALTGTPVNFTDERGGRILLNNIFPICDESGVTEKIAISSYDITSIKTNEELLNSIILNSPEGIMLLNPGGEIALANPSAESFFALYKELFDAFTGNINDLELFSIDKGLRLSDYHKDVLQTKEAVVKLDFTLSGPVDEDKYYTVSFIPIKIITERFEKVIFILSDNTERMKIRLELESAKKRVTDILESINDGFFVINTDRIITYVNAEAERTWGLKGDEIIGKPIEDVFQKRYFEAVYENFENAFKNKVYTRLEHYQKHLGRWFLLHMYPFEEGISIYFTDITSRKEEQLKVEEMAFYDTLTGLLNRRGADAFLEKAIISAIRNKTKLSICFMDLDGLKEINDTYGHNEGDALLQDAANVFREVFRGSDTICRLGGDEFLGILPGCGTTQAQIVRERIRSKMESFNRDSGHVYELEASIGFAFYNGDRAVSAEEFIKMADKEMYLDKKSKKALDVN